MSARKSQRVLDLEERVRTLSAYQEAFYCLRRGERPIEVAAGEGEDRQSVEVLGLSRASGGVVIAAGISVLFVSDWLAWNRSHADPYLREVARKVERAQTEAVKTRLAGKP